MLDQQQGWFQQKKGQSNKTIRIISPSSLNFALFHYFLSIYGHSVEFEKVKP